MFKDYLVIDKNLIPATSKILADEFYTAPLTNYIFSDENIRKKVLPLIFESLLNIYQESAITFITSEKLEGTFTLIDSEKSIYGFSFYGAILKSIPNILKTLANIELIETTKKLLLVEKQLQTILDFIKNLENYIFISSIAVKDQSTEEKFMEELLKHLTDASNSTNKSLLVETETKEMVNIYNSFGFKAVHEIYLSEGNITVYLLLYEPKQ